MEMSHKISSRIGSPNHMLLPKTNPDFLTGALCTTSTAQIPSPQKLINLNNLKTSSNKNSFGSLFDTSPEMPSPPVPPRIKTASNNASNNVNNSTSNNAPSNPLSSSFSSLAIYKNNTSMHSNNLMNNSLMPNLNSQTSLSSSSSPPLIAQPNSQRSLPTSNKVIMMCMCFFLYYLLIFYYNCFVFFFFFDFWGRCLLTK
jgi:hypothetical protein